MSDQSSIVNVLKLCTHVGTLKHLRRTGWVLMEVAEPETIAGHMYRMAVLGACVGARTYRRM
jgi:putative hydrolase of HD superfamily